MACAGKTLDKLGEEVDVYCSRPRLASYDGVPMKEQHFAIKYWRETREYRPRNDDVFIVTYPKSGTTWLQQIFFCLYNGRAPRDRDERIRNCPFLEHGGTGPSDTMYRPGALKVHTRFEHTPYAPNAKYVYCVRNPKDVCVSLYFHTIRSKDYISDCSFEEFFEFFMDGKVEFGNYWQHLESWYPMIGKENVLLLTYEDMKEDILRELARIGTFLGGEWEEKLKGDTAMKVAEMSSFESMRESYAVGGRPNFIRKGIINDWKNHMTDTMSQRMEEETYRRLRAVCPKLLTKWEELGILSGADAQPVAGE